MKKALIFISLIFAIIFLMKNISAYKYTGYSVQSAHSIKIGGSCNFNISSYLTYPGSALITSSFFSPYGTQIGTTTSFYSNVSYYFVGMFPSSSDNYHESSVTHTLGTGCLDVNYTCISNTGDWIMLSNAIPTLVDSLGYKPNTYRLYGGWNYPRGVATLTHCNTPNYAGISDSNTPLDGKIYHFPFYATSQYLNFTYRVVFDSSTTSWYAYAYIYDALDYTKIYDDGNIQNQLIVERNASITNLIPGRRYVFAVGISRNANMLTQGFTVPNITLWIYDAEPIYVCGDWSDCLPEGFRYRYCNDTTGRFPTKLEKEACYVYPFAEKVLGFEDSYEVNNISVCQKDWLCFSKVQNLTVEYPKNWTVAQGYELWFNFLKMTSEIPTTEGVKSLKMWYIPPKIDEATPVFYNETNETTLECMNSTIGQFAYVYRTDINNTLFVELNVTFPSPYMILSWDVKKCPLPELQYDTWYCGKLCYARNCTEKPLGRFGMFLVDQTTLKRVVNFYGFAKDEWETFSVDISNAGIVPGRTYTLVFAVNPENQYDINSHCLYVDNIKMGFAKAPLICESGCISGDPKFTYRKASLVGQACVYNLIEYYPDCMPKDLYEALTICEDHYCDCETLTYYKLKEVDGNCTIISKTQDSPICKTECETKKQEETLYEPIVNRTVFEQMGVGWMASLFIPIILVMFLSLGISGFISIKTNSWQFGSLAFLGFLLVFTIAGFFPVWLFIVFIIIAGFILARFLIAYMRGE